MNPDTLITKKLIEGVRKGNRKAQNLLYGQYCKAMYSTSLRILGNAEDAEDAMQEGFIEAYRSIAVYNNSVSFGAWLRKIVINKSIDMLRRRKTFLSFEDVPLEDKVTDSELDFGPDNSQELINRIKEVVAEMPDGYRLVVSLHLFEGLDHEEIGNFLGISPATSRSQLARARQKLLGELVKLKIEPVYE